MEREPGKKSRFIEEQMVMILREAGLAFRPMRDACGTDAPGRANRRNAQATRL
jgi:hypothetical protein